MTEIQEVFARLGEHLDMAAAGKTARTEPLVVTGNGASEDGMVEATLEGGKLSGVRIDARAMRQTGAELADKVKEAVNAALEDQMGQLAELVKNPTDVSDLRSELHEISEQAQQSLNKYMTGMQDLLHQAQDIAVRQEALR